MSRYVYITGATDRDTKDTIRQGAAVRGVTISRFITDAALREARNALRERAGK